MNEPNRLFIGGLDYKTTPVELKAFIESHGYVCLDAHVVMDHETGKSKGFGFVTLPGTENREAAILALNKKELSGRTLTVNNALPKAPRVAK